MTERELAMIRGSIENGFDQVIEAIRSLKSESGSNGMSKKVNELALCESIKLRLRVGELYRFEAIEGCEDCEKLLDEPYVSRLGEQK